MRRHTIIAIAITLILTACERPMGGPLPAQDEAQGERQTPVTDPVITIEDFEFRDGTVTIEEGTTVTWVWQDAPVEHNVVFDDFESPLQAEDTYTHTFDEAGTYDYHCEPHPIMTGSITVVEAYTEGATS